MGILRAGGGICGAGRGEELQHGGMAMGMDGYLRRADIRELFFSVPHGLRCVA